MFPRNCQIEFLSPRIPIALLFLLLCGANWHMCFAQNYTLQIDAKSGLYNAGRLVPNNPTPGDTVLLPPCVALPPGANRRIEFSSVTGTVTAGPGWPTVGPDGGDSVSWSTTCWGTNIFGYNGISGITAGRFLFLAGVLLSDSQPASGAEPDRLDFLAIGTDFLQLSPAIDQTFFIGNGSASTGQGQRFLVPDTATRFYLGFMDSDGFGWPKGGAFPSSYLDNTGTLTATFVVYSVPEPGAFAILGPLVVVLLVRAWLQHTRQDRCRAHCG